LLSHNNCFGVKTEVVFSVARNEFSERSITNMNTLPVYKYGAARTMVFLHGQYLQEFLAIWKKAKGSEITLPETDHPGYVSLEMLLKHVLGGARHYLGWICEQLDLPDPEISPAPAPKVIEVEAEAYLEHLGRQWRTPLSEIAEERFDKPVYMSEWGMQYSIDSMLEHAVMHPILHRVELVELLEEQVSVKTSGIVGREDRSDQK
jgi:uncharacterized damage-inducible protein DinB